MKQQHNRIISALLALLLCVGLFALPASAEESSGTCGENLSWTLANGVLTISGEGQMENYSEFSMPPWYADADRIQRVVIGQGVTSVGSMAFYNCTALVTVTLPDSVLILGELAFADCIALKQINLTAVQEIGRCGFYGCLALTNVILPDSLRIIGDQAFYRCKSLGGITVPASVTTFGSSVFTYCDSLVYAKILAPITELPYWTFYGCDVLNQLYLPDTVTSVGEYALWECPELYYVDFGGSPEAREEMYSQILEQPVLAPSDTDVSYTQTEGAVITTTSGDSGTTVTATVTDPNGWQEIADSINEAVNSGEEPTVEIQTESGIQIPEGALEELGDQEVTVTIQTSDNAQWQIVMRDQTADTLSGSQDLSVTVATNPAEKFADTLGDAASYTVTLGETSLNSTLLIPLGSQTARQVATLYKVDGKELKKLSSVIVDDEGKAAFSLAGTAEGEYVVALDVQDIPSDEVLIPGALAAQYDITYGATLMDSQGNQYVLTGRVNKLGISLGTLTLIVVGILVGSVVLVGIIMTIWNKQRKRNPK